MDVASVQRVCQGPLSGFPALLRALQGWQETKPNQLFMRRGMHFPAAEQEVTSEVYEAFRYTDWCFSAYPTETFGEGMATVCIYDKDFVDIPGGVVYHATRRENEHSIRDRGLLPGIRLGKSARHPQYSDSVYYIYASLSETAAGTWYYGHLNEQAEGFVYPVRIDRPNHRVFADPCSQGSDGSTEGYVIETDHVAFECLGGPMRLPGEDALRECLSRSGWTIDVVPMSLGYCVTGTREGQRNSQQGRTEVEGLWLVAGTTDSFNMLPQHLTDGD